ncbi:LPS export ABC transporter protein LptC [Dyadobacter sp. SG02]|uniref:LPS export ABC transporter periplasmic protein LptC n=1 Tax=Dyadobacter sp. SG02 TaxID=1855291 RepID=UPI0008C9ED62|nr:LPS export ABC transporter periplasmic protein LptC [Dyadobacter sp. SG02]SEI40727.1 LPS export ABC transporter protein LptC [Dyadobacter sp. SG02]
MLNIGIQKLFLKGDSHVSPFCILVLCVLLFAACESKKDKIGAVYNGPIEIVNDLVVKYSEQGNMKVYVKTPKSFTYQNETRVFPDSVNISFFDSLGTVVTTLRSDSGRYDRSADVYIVKGHVRVVKLQDHQILTTTELNWSPGTRKVFTDKALKIVNTQSPEVTHAVGMDAEQDFSRIKLRKMTGTVISKGF